MASGTSGVRQEQLGEIFCRNGVGREIRVIRFRFVATEITTGGLRERPGAQGWKTASNEEPVKFLDHNLYEVVSSGELLEQIS